MTGRVVEIAGDKRRLSLYRGFMEVRDDEDNLSRVMLDDLIAVVISGRGCTHSSNLLVELSQRGIAVIICDSNYRPQIWVLPIEGHHAQSARMQAQATAKLPLKKQLWKQIVRGKITNQAAVLDAFGGGGNGLRALVARVRSGDPANVEAQAARYYWQFLFGRDFLRDQNADGINALLNYGYAVIRACVARAVMAAGLHPTLGLHHRGASNSMCLVDDLMEPYRPLADCIVRDLADKGVDAVTPDAKRALASLAVVDISGPTGVSPLFAVIARLATSLAHAFTDGRALDIPPPPLPLDLRSLFSDTS